MKWESSERKCADFDEPHIETKIVFREVCCFQRVAIRSQNQLEKVGLISPSRYLNLLRKLNLTCFDKQQIEVSHPKGSVLILTSRMSKLQVCFQKSAVSKKQQVGLRTFRKEVRWFRQATCRDHNCVSGRLLCRYPCVILGQIVADSPAEILGRTFGEAVESSPEWACGWAG